jgi:hypothetical protein
MTRFVCNLNDQVFVRLTPIGAKVWLSGWPGGIPKETRERLTQPDGSIRFQLRQLLEIFGPTIFYSANHPYFEGNNLIIESSQQ